MTTWVFLRGLTREARHWGGFPEQFQAVFAGELAESDILTPDLPGNGRLYAAPSPARVDAMMEACRSALRERGRAPPYHLLALSLGGMVAVAWATRYPDECRAVVLLSTSLRPYSPFFERLRPSAYPTLLRLLVSSGEARERGILELTSARAAELQSVLPAWTEYARECPVSRGGALRQLLAAARFAAVDKPAIPLLILAGAGDRLVHPRCSRRLARAWNADFALHPSAGHDLALDDGEWVAHEVRTWLATQRR
ncbi:MAG: alpha/beta hydrolase [Hydrogenophilales bacterium 28-61-23]|nr:MAG: alpha/beta hydrolase [Hydrogenophilales bacterium 28-61-23]